MTDARMQIIIDGNASGAVDATKQAENAMSRLSGTLKGLAIGGGVLMLARKGFDILSDAIKGTVRFLGDCIDEAANAEMQLTKLNTSLKSTGNFTQEASDELVKYAESLQSMTAFEDDAIVSVEAMLATFKLNKDEIKIATQAVLDLASATGQDLQSAAILLGKAMVGETGMLKRYGIIVDENKYAAEGWKAVIDEINVEFGGQALAQAETYTGKLAQMKNAFSDIKETIGGAFIPVLSELFGEFTKGREVIDPVTGAVTTLKSPMQELAEIVKKAAEGMKTFIELHWEDLQNFISNAWGKIKEFIDALKNADWSGFRTSIENLGESFGFLIGGDDSGLTGANKAAQDFVNSLAFMVNGFSVTMLALKILGDGFMSFGELIGYVFTAIQASIMLVKGDYGDAVTLMQIANKGLWESAEKLSGDFQKMAEVMAKAMSTSADSVNKTLVPSVENATSAVNDLATALNNIPLQVSSTVTTYFQSLYSDNQNQSSAKAGKGLKFSGGVIAGSGLFARDTQWISDLSIPVVKGEAILPAYVVRAIKENKSSFAGLDTSSGGGVTNNFNIGELVVREEADIYRISEELYNMQKTSLRGAGIR